MKTYTLQFALATFLALLLTGCGSTPLEATSDFDQQFDFSKVHTIALLPIDRTSLNSITVSDMQVNRMNAAMTAKLQASGFEVIEDHSKADLLLSWHLVTREKTDIRSYNSMSYYHCWRCGPTVSDISVRQYTEGTLIVDMIDPVRGQSVWRSTVQSRLKSQPDPEASEALRQEAVAALFARFPPAQGATPGAL